MNDDFDEDEPEEQVDPDMVWLEKAAVHSMIAKHAPDLIEHDRVKSWVAATATAYFGTMMFLELPDFSVFLGVVRGDPELQRAVASAWRIQAGAIDIVDMIQNWRSECPNE